MGVYWQFDINYQRYIDDPFSETDSPDADTRTFVYEEKSRKLDYFTIDAETELDYEFGKQGTVKNAEVIYIITDSPAYVRLNGSYQNIPVANRLFLTNDSSVDAITKLRLVNKSKDPVNFQILVLGTNEEFTGISEVF